MSDEYTDHNDKMYNLICKERFDKIDSSQDKIIDLLRGKNSTPGLIDEVRILKSRWTIIFGALAVLSTALVAQIIQWIFKIL